jgi:hypothetical protein
VLIAAGSSSVDLDAGTCTIRLTLTEINEDGPYLDYVLFTSSE